MPIFKTVLDANALNEDVVLKQFYNVSGAGVSPYTPLFLDVVVQTNGVAATQAKSAATGSLFLGVVAKDTDDSNYGLATIYGQTYVVVSQASAGVSPGVYLSAKGAYFDDSTLSGAIGSGWDQVTLMETIAASAGFSSSAVTATYLAFIKAM